MVLEPLKLAKDTSHGVLHARLDGFEIWLVALEQSGPSSDTSEVVGASYSSALIGVTFPPPLPLPVLEAAGAAVVADATVDTIIDALEVTLPRDEQHA
ncbi:hypothetical protein K7X08_027757 [Anisodus acutangulus]|uniref:Uncharacterized protein n=1 Tax=Anisodus acutangulus TaxID=402998 RepID=A0A9Q1LMB9_9SOLA|nr:hypothetical protein K7X08_027757 [Anisodus acutangulus]